jgi:hypothetical protein
VIISVLPIVFGLFSTLFWWVIGKRRKLRDPESEDAGKTLKVENVVSITVFIFIFHASIVSQSLSVFGCRKLENGTWLLKDLSLSCYDDSDHIYMVIIGLISI